MPRLPENFFEATRREFVKGLILDLTSKVDHKGNESQLTQGGEIIKIKKAKPVKAVRTIKPAIQALTSEFDATGRTLEDHRAMVDFYSGRLDSKRQLSTDGDITDKETLKNCNVIRTEDNTPAYRPNRGKAATATEAFALLGEVFVARHKENDKDD